MKRPVATFLHGGVAVIEAEADIRKSAEEVFDYASDPANESEWNISPDLSGGLMAAAGRRGGRFLGMDFRVWV